MRTREQLLAAAAAFLESCKSPKVEVMAFMTDLIETWVVPKAVPAPIPEPVMRIVSHGVEPGYPKTGPSPIEVHVAPTGAIYLDGTANRFYTPEEATSLAYEILSQVESVS